MLEIRYTAQFKRDLKSFAHNRVIRGELAFIVSKLITNQSLPRKYKVHKLIGSYIRMYECHIKPDVLLIFDLQPNELVLVRIGSHSELF